MKRERGSVTPLLLAAAGVVLVLAVGVADVGILVSTDPVAIDQAAVDLVNGAQGLAGSKLTDLDAQDKINAISGIRWQPILEHAERLGLGNRKYALENVD